MRFDEHFVTGVLSDVSILYNTFPQDHKFSINSRTLLPGDIFVALPGMRFDGHDYIAQAFEKGAAGCIISADKKHVLDALDTTMLKNKLVLVVSDTLQALLRLAVAWRAQFTYPVVGVTGSVGKTSTKELLVNIFTQNGTSFIASYDNQNTKIGLSLNILRMRASHQVAIFELGISKRGEMAELAELVRPTSAIITNIGHQHMDGLGSLYDIALEKRDIFKCFTEDSIGIVFGDQSVLSHVAYTHPVIRFGSKTTNQIQARKIRVDGTDLHFVMKIYKNKYPITLKHTHMGAVFNILAATAVAYLLRVPDNIIVQAVQKSLKVAGRFEQLMLKRYPGTLINDCYNASPESMKASLLAFQNLETSAQKVAVLGDMLGLGVNSQFWHRQIGRFLRKTPSVKQVILVGNMVQWIQETIPVGTQVDLVSSWQDAVELLDKKLYKESVVLVKGSHDVGLGNLVDVIST
ncbi:MAG TPA: UDP-N-acetylmuramoyl-tripeptide--D-alanyl-D-alanine ligase [Candidatus Dependentiae bacterium]|nr:UDP-N-acetylmuramoyl-tripeptide--D-alanyl-D-alanine ligase [Candidatus Dependentiae bacterium]HRQ62527.1 UDP-N-acetylmuramoyl-tripeptide--D-alanyl-D-alanine ligase [Candidatus Dependentiae bacterium]